MVARVGLIAATNDSFRALTDAADFDRHAVSIAQGHGYPPAAPFFGGGPTAFRPPAFPHFVAAVYLASGTDFPHRRQTAARLAEAVTGTIAVALVGLVALQLWGSAVAVAAMALASVYPPFLIPSTSLLSESIFLPLELGAIAAVLAFRRSPRLRWVALAGVLAGLATLTRSNGAIVLLVLALGVLGGVGWKSPRAWKAAALLCSITALVVAPWTIRNAEVMDAFVPVSTQSGLVMGGQYNDAARQHPSFPAFWVPPWGLAVYRDVFTASGRTEITVDRHLRRRSLSYIQRHPDYLAEVALWNTARLLGLQGTAPERLAARYLGVPSALAAASVYAFWVLATLALLALALTAARRLPRFLWLLPVALVPSVVFFGGSVARYRLPADPIVVWLAALALVHGGQQLRLRWRRP